MDHLTTSGDNTEHDRDFLLQRATRLADAAALVRQAAAKLDAPMVPTHQALLEQARGLERNCADILIDLFEENAL